MIFSFICFWRCRLHLPYPFRLLPTPALRSFDISNSIYITSFPVSASHSSTSFLFFMSSLCISIPTVWRCVHLLPILVIYSIAVDALICFCYALLNIYIPFLHIFSFLFFSSPLVTSVFLHALLIPSLTFNTTAVARSDHLSLSSFTQCCFATTGQGRGSGVE